MTRRVDYTGQRFGRLVALRFVQRAGRRTTWEFQCDCGNTVSRDVHNAVNGYTNSCGCLRIESTLKNLAKVDRTKDQWCKLPTGEASKRALFNHYKSAAKKKGLDFELSLERFTELTSSICHYCDTPPRKVYTNSKVNNGGYLCNGVDRLDSAKGYVEGNIVGCCTKCNLGKHTMSERDFLDWVQKVYHNLKKRGDI
jgi:hypothetical protein